MAANHYLYYTDNLAPDLIGELRPSDFFYWRPYPLSVPNGFFESMWTHAYFDEIGGVLPDFEVLFVIDVFSFLLGGAVSCIYSYIDKGIYGRFAQMRCQPQVEWYEELLPVQMYEYFSVKTYLFFRYVGRFLWGGFVYFGIRGLVHSTMYYFYGECNIHSSAMYLSTTAYITFWGVYYTEKPALDDFGWGMAAGLGMAIIEQVYGYFWQFAALGIEFWGTGNGPEVLPCVG